MLTHGYAVIDLRVDDKKTYQILLTTFQVRQLRGQFVLCVRWWWFK